MRIRITKGWFFYGEETLRAGDVVDVVDAQALHWIAEGIAEAFGAEEEHAVALAPEKAVARRKAK